MYTLSSKIAGIIPSDHWLEDFTETLTSQCSGEIMPSEIMLLGVRMERHAYKPGHYTSSVVLKADGREITLKLVNNDSITFDEIKSADTDQEEHDLLLDVAMRVANHKSDQFLYYLNERPELIN